MFSAKVRPVPTIGSSIVDFSVSFVSAFAMVITLWHETTLSLENPMESYALRRAFMLEAAALTALRASAAEKARVVS